MGVELADELELVACAVEVVVGAFGGEVLVAEEVVGEEAEADFEGEEFSGEWEVGDFGGCEDAGHFFEESAGEGLEDG